MSLSHSVRFSVILLSLLFTASALQARPAVRPTKRTEPARFMRQFNLKSNLDFAYTNKGILFNNDNYAGLMWPRGSQTVYLFAGGLWFAANKMVNGGQRSLCAITYNPNSGMGWFKEGESSAPDDGANHDEKYLSYNSRNFTATGEPMLDEPLVPTYLWPIWQETFDPVGRDFNFGQYISASFEREQLKAQGKAPVFLSDETIVNVYNDQDTSQMRDNLNDRDGYPLGLEVVETIYSWGFGRYRDVVFVRYQIQNTSDDTLRDCYIGFPEDADVGKPGATAARNDHTSFISESVLSPANLEIAKNALAKYGQGRFDSLTDLNMGMHWSEQEDGKELGMIGFSLVETPAVDVFGKLTPNRMYAVMGANSGYGPGSSFEQDKLGLTTFRNWSIVNDPLAHERYPFLSSRQKDGDGGEGDSRVMMGTGPFDLQPYAIATSTIAIFIAKRSESDRNENLDSLIGLGVQVQDMFGRLVDRGTGTFGTEHFPGSTADVPIALPVPFTQLQIYPSPANDRCTIRVNASSERNVSIEIIDMSGAVVLSLSAQVVSGMNEITLDLRVLSAGNYIARIDHQTQAFTIVR